MIDQSEQRIKLVIQSANSKKKWKKKICRAVSESGCWLGDYNKGFNRMEGWVGFLKKRGKKYGKKIDEENVKLFFSSSSFTSRFC